MPNSMSVYGDPERIKGAVKGTTGRFRRRLEWRSLSTLHKIRKKTGLLPDPTTRRIIVGIGMHRTGTRSLAQYLSLLGFRVVHWPWWSEHQVRAVTRDPEVVADILEPMFFHYDAFTDVPFPGLYKVLDKRFPESRFVLIRRDPEQWWNSLCRHWGLEGNEYHLDPFEVIAYAESTPSDLCAVSRADEGFMKDVLLRHTHLVENYFATRPEKLLVVDLEDDAINKRISDFLGLNVIPYPHERSAAWP